MIGILTFNRAFNYGAILQAFALKSAVSKNHDCDVLNYKCPHIEKARKHFNRSLLKGIIHYLEFNVRNKKFKRFIADNSTKIIFSNENITNLCGIKIIVGSDQVWNYNCSGEDKTFLLANINVKKYSYAASFGIAELPTKDIPYFKQHLSKFQYLSVREKTGQSICKNQLGLYSEVVLDPTLLLTKEEWAERFAIQKKNKKYILVYSLNMSKEFRMFARKISQELKLPIYNISTGLKDFFGNKIIKSAGPKEWVDLFYNAEFIVTDSFHGTAFSVNFNKPFYSFANNNRASRIVDLLTTLGLQERLNPTIGEVNPKIEIDYVSVNKKLEQERKKSIAFLEKIIND